MFNLNHFTAVCDRKDALTSVLENLDMYRKRAEEASKSRANIIVFPEVSYDIKHQYDIPNRQKISKETIFTFDQIYLVWILANLWD